MPALPSLQELPPNSVTVRNGKVVKVQNWVLWNGQPWPTITIKREENGTFVSDIGDPEHGGGKQRGTTVLGVVQGLHPKFQKQYEDVFALDNPTDEAIAAAGFAGYKVVRE